MFKIVFYIFIILIIWLILIRIIRKFIHFPIPSFLTRFIDNPIRRLIQPPRKIIDLIDIKKGMKICEIGPGYGTFTIEAAKQVSKTGKVFTIDIQSKVISILNNRIEKYKIKNVITKVGSASKLPFLNKNFDRVFMITVLGEIDDKKKALIEINRVLKGNGLLAIGELLLDPDYPSRKSVIRWCKDANFNLVKEYRGFLHYLLIFRKIKF